MKKKRLDPYKATVKELIEDHEIRNTSSIVAYEPNTPTAFERAVDREVFFGALETMRKHYSPEEIRGFVETHFRLENYKDLRFNFVREVQLHIKSYLEKEQSFYIKKVKDGLEEAFKPFDNVEMIAVAKDSVELGYLAEGLFHGILEVLEDRV